MKKLLALLVLIAIALFAGSPYYTAYQLKNAIEATDGDALVSHVDFAQLQPNIQQQLSSKFAMTLNQYPLVAQLGGDALTQTADTFIASAVDNAVTADNVKRLITTQGQANAATKELAAAWAIATNRVDLQNLIQQMIVQRGDVNAVIKGQINQIMDKQAEEIAAQAKSSESNSDTPELKYCGISCFTITSEVKGYPVTLEMQRQGLIGWKIVDVALP